MICPQDGINMLEMLAKCGFTSYELRRQHIFGESTIQKLRGNDLTTLNLKELNFICKVLAYDVGELIKYVPD